jgi:hypothetical protein
VRLRLNRGFPRHPALRRDPHEFLCQLVNQFLGGNVIVEARGEARFGWSLILPGPSPSGPWKPGAEYLNKS